jgi:hypothetical protein
VERRGQPRPAGGPPQLKRPVSYIADSAEMI